MKLVALSNPWLVICEWTGHHDFVDHDTIVVNFGKAVRLFQVIEADFIVLGYVVAFSSTCNSNYNILDTGITMNKADIVVE